MLYSTLVKFYMRLEATTKRLEMTDILAELFVAAEPDDLERLIYLTQGKIHPDWTGEPEIGMAEKMVVATIARASGLSKAKVESILSKIGDVGLAAEMILKDKRQVMFGQKSPSVFDVYNVFDQIAKESGKGSSSRKIGRLVKVMMSTSPLGARYLARTVVGTLRLGVGDMTILDALSLAFTGSSENRGQLERAYNLTSDLGAVARTLAEEGLESVSDAQIVLGKPIRMMLAQRLSTPEEILEKLENFSAEYKLD
ncbi:MAG: DNA ligase, partial [Candidatus Bathyarchaeota archaeon]|nr:DNA ligase [Candidatus Bathyarchaeota archaeon]